MRASRWTACALWLALTAAAWAGGPRFVTGPPFFTGTPGQPIGWKQANLTYFTDPGDLSATVKHQAADAIVAAAAGVWNVPVASISVAQGGELAEHVSAANTYLDTSGLVFPADVMAGDAAAVPIAVIYDADGSVTDLLLGSGASEPSGCRQNGVTETVDSFDPAGYILHAIIVVNGRCTATAAAAQLELQYQLERAFGRVLGLAWSQTNDNVFTGSPAPTVQQELNWPVMHPLDIICGPYSYQCMLYPFQLRPDDIAAMVAVYPIAQGSTPAAGKQVSLAEAHAVTGSIAFPTGEGMAGVNVLVQRQPEGTSTYDGWFETSAVTGASFRAAGTSPFLLPPADAYGSFGTRDLTQMGVYTMAYVPSYAVPWQNVMVSTEPVNPLYAGQYSLGPYGPGDVTPSGATPAPETALAVFPGQEPVVNFSVSSAAAVCGNGQDGTPAAPVVVPASGWWNGLLCGYGHASYLTYALMPGRTFTLEVTALDETGAASESKAMPVVGLFAPTDSPGSLPSLGVTDAAFDSDIFGMTSITASSAQMSSFWFGIADERGDGRPDYNFQARLFYADSIVPAEIGASGGTLTIAGLGFRQGNAVTINGVAAQVQSWTANAIVLTAPTMAAAKATNGAAVDLEVRDLTTGATSTMSAALTYTSAPKLPNVMKLVSAPAGTVFTGSAANPAFAVQVLKPDGATPVAGDSVVFTATAGSVSFAACGGSATCTLTTDANGMASSAVTPLAPGPVTLQASDGALAETASFTAEAPAGYIQIWILPPATAPVGQANLIALTDHAADRSSLPGRTITFTVTSGSAIFSVCASPVCTITTDSNGNALINLTATAPGTVSFQVADGSVTASGSFMATSAADTMTVVSQPAASVYLTNWSGSFAVKLLEADGVTPDPGETVTFTASPGVVLQPCQTNVCATPTGWNGQASVAILAPQPGTYEIQAIYGSLSASANFSVLPTTQQIQIVSAPTGNLPVGVPAATVFSAQVLQDGTTPLAGVMVAFSAAEGSVSFSTCIQQRGNCWLWTDSNGMISTTVTPLAPGTIVMNAVYLNSTASASFNAVGVGETMTQIDPPGDVWVGDSVNLQVQVMSPGGFAGFANDLVEFSVIQGALTFTAWPFQPLQAGTDANGMASEAGVPTAPGTIQVLATDGRTSQTFTFQAKVRPDVLNVISQPASGAITGTAAATPFAVQVLLADAITVVPGRNVTVTVTGGSATLAGCGAATCVLTADSTGIVSTLVTPLSAGAITLTANDGGVTQTISFTAVGVVKPDIVTLLAAPATSVYVGATTSSAIALQVTLPDGVTPAPGVAVTFAVSPQSTGSVTFAACGTATCTLSTDTNGMVATPITGVSAGDVTVIATAALPTGAANVTASLQVMANQFSLTAQNARTYVAAGQVLTLELTADAAENGSPAPGQTVTWTAGAGFLAAVNSSVTDSNGATGLEVVLGPLNAGATARMTACAWSTVCAEFDAASVGPAAQQVAITSGDGQAGAGGTVLAPVIATVTDGQGHPVAAAPVSVYQTVTALVVCPARGRCPAAAVLEMQAVVLVSAIDGTVAITPLTVSGTATSTQIAISAGTLGFATASVTNQP